MDFVFDSSLVLYLPLYQLDGTSFMSKDKYGHLCTVTGALWTPQGRSFDGVDDYIQLPALPSVMDFTFEIWMKCTGAGSVGFTNYGMLTESGFNRLSYEIASGQFLAQLGAGNHFSTNSLALNTWGHVVYTYTSADTTGTWWINGVSGGTNVGAATFSTTRKLGAVAGLDNYFYKGIFGEAIVYNRALSYTEILNNYLVTKWRYA